MRNRQKCCVTVSETQFRFRSRPILIYMCSGTFLPLHMAYGIVWDSYSDAIVVWLSIF